MIPSIEQMTQALLFAASTGTFERLDKSVSSDLTKGTEYSPESVRLAQNLSRKVLTELKNKSFNNTEFS